jgi:hypothetical protein
MTGNWLILLFLSLLAFLPLPANLARVNVVKGREQKEIGHVDNGREAKSKKFLTIFKKLFERRRVL